MALNLKKISEKRRAGSDGQNPERSHRSAPSARTEDNPFWHGRKSPPPPRGSTWDEYLDWACEGGFERDGDASLAMRFWTGLEPREEDTAVPSAPAR